MAVNEHGERPVTVELDAERWSYVQAAIVHTLNCGEAGYELRHGGSELRDALAIIERCTRA